MLVFVYGTLRKSDCRASVLDDYECLCEEAYVDGFKMLNLGSFPGIVPGAGRVRGEVYDIGQRCLQRLDLIEGYQEDDPEHSLYWRKEVQVSTPDGETIDKVFTYVFNRSVTKKDIPVVASGDWFEVQHAVRN